MDRRKILLILAALIAAFGTLLVFLYVQSADSRAREKIETVDVLRAVQPIEAGEAFDDAQAAGKFELQDVPQDQVLPNAQDELGTLSGTVATTQIFPGEQVISDKWGGEANVTSNLLAIPEDMVAISVNLTDPARVAGFVNPGSSVAIFFSGTEANTQEPFARLLLQEVRVLGVGDTSTLTTTKTTEEGEQTTEELPRTLMTLAVSQEQSEKLIFGAANGELSFALRTENSKVSEAGPMTQQDLFR
jgi:pilus assembly protein CpaB